MITFSFSLFYLFICDAKCRAFEVYDIDVLRFEVSGLKINHKKSELIFCG